VPKANHNQLIAAKRLIVRTRWEALKLFLDNSPIHRIKRPPLRVHGNHGISFLKTGRWWNLIDNVSKRSPSLSSADAYSAVAATTRRRRRGRARAGRWWGRGLASWRWRRRGGTLGLRRLLLLSSGLLVVLVVCYVVLVATVGRIGVRSVILRVLCAIVSRACGTSGTRRS
jgi:hypothetical protein